MRRAVAYRFAVSGDSEIGAALAAGMKRGTYSVSAEALQPSPTEEGMGGRRNAAPTTEKGMGGRSGDRPYDGEGEADRARAEAEKVADRWIEGERLKRAVGNYKTPEEYEAMIEAAREEYGQVRINPVSCAVLAMIGLLVLMMTTFLEWEETKWRA